MGEPLLIFDERGRVVSTDPESAGPLTRAFETNRPKASADSVYVRLSLPGNAALASTLFFPSQTDADLFVVRTCQHPISACRIAMQIPINIGFGVCHRGPRHLEIAPCIGADVSLQ